LRERRDDIPLLAEFFLRKKATKMGRKAAPRLSPEAAATLAAHNFPGNVRELENAMEYALNMLGDRDTVQPDDLPDRVQGLDATGAGPQGAAAGVPGAIPKDLLLDEAVMALEVDWVNRAMKATSGNISQAAK